MKKNYIVPAVVTESVLGGILMEGSLQYDSSKTIGDQSQGGWTRRQIWADEEEQ